MNGIAQRLMDCRAVVICVTLLVFEQGVAATDTTARGLFAELKASVYQVRVIDVASSDKYTIGSGFQIDGVGHIATNFHVVSAYVNDPHKYDLEIQRHDGKRQSVTVVAVDVVHDLAIIKAEGLASDHLALQLDELSNGDRIYSMGNPHDLGMTIIEGNYNGRVKHSRYKKLLFSGSLNGGMSGGPALNSAGEVIGVNVSKGGEQLSFLVPARFLNTLIALLPGEQGGVSFAEQMTADLLADQAQFYQQVFSSDAPPHALGDMTFPGKLSEALECWGHSVDKDDIEYQAVHQHCKSHDRIYVDEQLQIGEFFYNYEWIDTDTLNRFQFYTFLQERFEHIQLHSSDDEEQVDEYSCETALVDLTSGSWKVSTCQRGYKKHPGLYDALLVMALVDFPDHSAIIKAGASGISKDNARALYRTMMEDVRWAR